MLFTHRLSITAAVSVGLLSIAVVGFAMRARTNDGPTSKSEAKLEVERITIREWGCEPKQINRGAGPFLLVIQNQSGLPEIDLSLVEESGRVRNRVPDTRNALTWRQRLELPPGTYSIKETSHPDWQCQITIGN